MAIFSRRTLQRLIEENAGFLSKRQTRKHVEALNRMDEELSLAAEWEILFINAFSKFGNVVHEKQFGGSALADIYFEPRDDPTKAFVADITTVSDRGLEESNPQDVRYQELMNIAGERGLRQISFNVRGNGVKSALGSLRWFGKRSVQKTGVFIWISREQPRAGNPPSTRF